MAHNAHLANVAANAAADAVTALLNSGILRVYDGSQPATGDTAISTQVLLAEMVLNSTAFGASVAGVSTANAIASDSSANATGTAAWFRVFKSDGTTAVFDGSVGTSGADLNFPTVAFVAAAQVDITSFTYTQSKS